MKKVGLLVGFVFLIMGLNSFFPSPRSAPPQSIDVELELTPKEQLPSPTGKTLKVSKLDLTAANVTYLRTEVNYLSVNKVVQDIADFNEQNNKPIYLILDTPGGSVLDGGRLITAIETSKNPIYAVDVGIAASMGFMILEHAHKRLAVPRAILMAHPASIGATFNGELDKAVSRLSFLKHYVDKMDRHIAHRVGISYETFKLLSDKEFWVDAADALEQGYLDGLVDVKLPSEQNFSPEQNKLKESIRME